MSANPSQIETELGSVWTDASRLMAKLDAGARAGFNALIKVDGHRETGSIYTVILSGPLLGEEFFRQDGPDLLGLLTAAVEFCDARRFTTGE